MNKTNVVQKIKGYVNLANRAGYIIWGTDNLKGYTHKLYLILYREDYGTTIQKTVNRFENVESIMLSIDDYNEIIGNSNSKIIGIKNKGLSDQIINLLRGEDG